MFEVRDKMGTKLTRKEILEKTVNRLANILLDFELMLLRWAGHLPFHTVRKWIYQAAGVRIGKGSVIHMWANFFRPDNIAIGEDTIIGDHVFLDGRAPLRIGNHTDIASSVMIYNSQHDIHSGDFHAVEQPVEIGDYVFIGPRVIILPGVSIGDGAVVAAGAVVSRNIDSGTIAGGVPAVNIGKRKITNPRYKLGRARLFQ